MRLSSARIPPIRKARCVPLNVGKAFQLFTTEMGSWWPVPTHSVAEDQSSGIRFDEFVGGRVTEVTEGGTEYSWADVIAWDPPHRFVLAWHPTVQAPAATIIEVRFEPLHNGGTQVELEHRAWEELGANEGTVTRETYDTGWDLVLKPFERASAARAENR